ncbi:hypothetical protein, conserved [Leishmania tarentolae]|uniref:Uncharacterized protein n=1 Tax=Leishmania tarentolae TaxID=5689 RepID=A0A640KFW2_LEITA|nr:hypothetical protein, conserved [Leishmania tarentolae]
MMLMSQSLSTYSLVQCVVSAAQFTSGEICFYDTYAELTASDADGNSTSPLRVEYDVLEHFRIVRAQGIMRLTLPRGVVRRWAAQNAFESQLDEYEGEPVNTYGCSSAEAGTVSGQTTAVLLLQLGVEDMSAFMLSIAPLIAASRRTRSVSRISVTEPLPVYGVPLVDPAGSIRTDAATSPREMSTASASSQEDATDVDSAGDENNAAPVRCRQQFRRQRQRQGEGSTAHCTASCTDDNAEHMVECAPAKDTALGASEAVAELLGGDSDGCAAGVTGAKAHRDVQISGSPAAPAGGEHEDGKSTARRISGPASAFTIAATETVAQADRRAPSSKHRSSQQSTPSRFYNTLESVAEELAELVAETEQPEHCRGGRGEPLHRRRPTVEVAMTVLRCADQQKASRRIRRQPLPITTFSAAPSLCPSLMSTISETHVQCHPQQQQSPSATAAKLQCEAHATPDADSVPAAKKQQSYERPMGLKAHMQGRGSARVTRNGGGGAHLCASELSFTASTKLPQLTTPDACDGCAEPREGDAMPSPKPEEALDGVHKTATTSDSAVCDVHQVRHICDGGAGSDIQWAGLRSSTATHGFSNASKGGCREHVCAAPVSTPTRPPSRSSSAASSVQLGDMLAVSRAVNEPETAAGGIIASSRRIAPCSGDGAGAVPLKPLPPYTRSGSAADVAAYMRGLFPVEDTILKPTRQRRKVQAATAVGSVKELSASQRRRRAPARRAVTRTASPTAAASHLVSTGKPVKAVPSLPLPSATKLNDDISVSAVTRATAQRRPRSPTVRALGTARKRAKVNTAAAAHLSYNSVDAAQSRETNTEATAGGGTAGKGAAACLTKPAQREEFCSASVPTRVAVSVRDADALGLIQAPLLLRSAASAAKPDAVETAFVAASAEEEAAAYAAAEEVAAADALNGDVTEAVGGLIKVPSTEAEVREVPRDSGYRRGTELPRAQLVMPEVASPAGGGSGTSCYHTVEVVADHHKNGDRDSISSSQVTCPLLYCRESRKERSRRVLRYMNLISQSIAIVHETHDALRGLLLLMMEDTQL